MQDKTKALVERLRDNSDPRCHQHVPSLSAEAAHTIEAQAQEIERLKAQLAEALGLLGAARHVMAPEISLRGEIKAFIYKYRLVSDSSAG